MYSNVALKCAVGAGRHGVRTLRRAASGTITVAVAMVSTATDADTGGNFQYEQYCIACHGADARGVDGLGVDLVVSPFVAGTSEENLVEFLKLGRMADDPTSRSNRPMPSFAWAPEADLQAVANWLKSKAGK